jgi:hypothetical protein
MTLRIEPLTPPRIDPGIETGMPSWVTSLLVILLMAAILRLAALVGFEGTIQDGVSRVGTARAWIVDGIPIFGRTVWPEGNYLLPAAALLCWDDPYWSVRIMYAIIGLTNVWLVYQLGTAVYGRTAGVTAAWVVALMPLHILVSTDVAMSEGPYITFILLALLAIVQYTVKPNPWFAAAAGLSLTIATTFRIDGVFWGIPLALSIAFVAFDRRITPAAAARDLILMGFCGLLYPVALFVQWTLLYPDPFYMIDQARLNSHQFFGDGKHSRWPAWLYQSYVVAFWPIATFVLLTPIVAALGWVGVFSAIRGRHQKAAALVSGLAVISVWLAYAAFTHDILAQWRYALVLAVVLAVFCAPGARVFSSFLNLSLRVMTVVAVAVALASQGLITYVAFVDYGVLTRQLGSLSPIRPNQFDSRAMLDWIKANSTSSSTVLITPHVLEQPYFSMRRGDLQRSGRIIAQQYYASSALVHSRASLTSELVQKLKSTRYVATSMSLRELGLRDDLVRELVRPVQVSDGTYVWQGIRLRLLQRFGSDLLWEVMPAQTSN